MADNVTDWAWRYSQSRHSARMVLLALAQVADEGGGSLWLSIAEIAELADIGERTASSALRTLEGLGELRTARNAGPNGVHRFQIVMFVPDMASDHPAAIRARARAERQQAYQQRRALMEETTAESAGGVQNRLSDLQNRQPSQPILTVGGAESAVGGAESAPVEAFKTRKNLDAHTREGDPSPADDSTGLSEFLAAHPRTESAGRVRHAWPGAMRAAGGDHQMVIAAARRYAERMREEGREPRFVRSAHRWLDDQGWLEERERPQRSRAELDRRLGDALAAARLPADPAAYAARQREIIAEVTAAYDAELAGPARRPDLRVVEAG